MTDPFGLVRFCLRFFHRTLLLGALLAMLLAVSVAGPGLDAASAADPRLEKAQKERADVQQRLDALTERIEETRAAVESSRNELARLREEAERHEDVASAAEELRRERARTSYMNGSGHVALKLLAADDATDVLDQTRFLAWMSAEGREELEAATAAVARTNALADHTEELVEQLHERESTLAEQQKEVNVLLERAVQAEKDIKAVIAEEEAQAARRAAAARSSRSGNRSPSAGSAAAAPVTGGVACPVGLPRTYVDSWGAPRSGGRSHAGTDILAPHGTVTPAYESGVISRISSNSLGGISLYLRGDSGNVYYYTHLSGYAGISVGQRVEAGQVLAYVGSTGNAGGINHLHFEVRPGGGGNVNPYSYVRRACG